MDMEQQTPIMQHQIPGSSNGTAAALGTAGGITSGIGAIGGMIGGLLTATGVGAAVGVPLTAISSVVAGTGSVIGGIGGLAGKNPSPYAGQQILAGTNRMLSGIDNLAPPPVNPSMPGGSPSILPPVPNMANAGSAQVPPTFTFAAQAAGVQ